MYYKDEDAFAKAMKGQKAQGAYLLYGSERYLIENWAERITAQFGGEFDSFNLQKLDGRRLDGDELLDAVETLPLIAGEKCVLLDDLDTKALAANGLDRLLEALGDLPPACTLVITGKPGTFDPKSAAGKKIIKACGDAGSVVQLGARGPSGLVSFVRGAAKKRGCELPSDTARYLLQICETDMHILDNEVAKICAYSGGGEITREHVDAVAIPRTEARVFDLSKAILAGNPQRAMELLRDLFYLREQPVAILSVLSMTYTDLYRARVAKDSGRSVEDVVALFGYKGREFRVRGAYSSRIQMNALRGMIQALMECDRRLKSTGTDGQVLLEQTVIRLFQLQGGR